MTVNQHGSRATGSVLYIRFDSDELYISAERLAVYDDDAGGGGNFESRVSGRRRRTTVDNIFDDRRFVSQSKMA